MWRHRLGKTEIEILRHLPAGGQANDAPENDNREELKIEEGFLVPQTPLGITLVYVTVSIFQFPLSICSGLACAEEKLHVKLFFEERGTAFGIAKVFGCIAAGFDLKRNCAALERCL